MCVHVVCVCCVCVHVCIHVCVHVCVCVCAFLFTLNFAILQAMLHETNCSSLILATIDPGG